MYDQIVTINFEPNNSTPPVVNVSQYDVGRPIMFKVYDGSKPADFSGGGTVYVQGTKPSGLGFSENATVEQTTENIVKINTTLAMTQESGMIMAELRYNGPNPLNVGTANFILAVEKTPHAEGTTDGTTETMADLQSQLDALDTRVEALEAGGGVGGLTEAVKSAMLQIAQKVAYIDEHGQTYYDTLYNALYPPAELVSISAVYTQSGTVYDTDTLDSLRSDLVVTAHMSDSTTRTVTDYTLSGTLTDGTSTITVSYGGKTTAFNVTVSQQGVNIASTPYAMTVSAATQSWNASTQTATLHSAGTSNYPGLILNGLLYTLGDVYDKTVRLRCTATLTDACRLIFALGTYTTVNPANNGAARKASANIYEMTSAGTIDINVTGVLSELFPSSTVMTNYLGLGLMINGANGVTATVTDIIIEVY